MYKLLLIGELEIARLSRHLYKLLVGELQGDEADWQYKAALMGGVYSNSVLNLAAEDAADGYTEMFFERDTTQRLG